MYSVFQILLDMRDLLIIFSFKSCKDPQKSLILSSMKVTKMPQTQKNPEATAGLELKDCLARRDVIFHQNIRGIARWFI